MPVIYYVHKDGDVKSWSLKDEEMEIAEKLIINYGGTIINEDEITNERSAENMDKRAIQIVRDYVIEHLDKSDSTPVFDVFTVWKCYILGNVKYLISTTLPDGMYYEVTYNKDKDEIYLDAYKKFENRLIK